jgi:hypothetical protein
VGHIHLYLDVVYNRKHRQDKGFAKTKHRQGFGFGGAGAVVGAVSGAKPKEKNVFYTTLTYLENNEEKTILFKVEQFESFKLIKRIKELIGK